MPRVNALPFVSPPCRRPRKRRQGPGGSGVPRRGGCCQGRRDPDTDGRSFRRANSIHIDCGPRLQFAKSEGAPRCAKSIHIAIDSGPRLQFGVPLIYLCDTPLCDKVAINCRCCSRNSLTLLLPWPARRPRFAPACNWCASNQTHPPDRTLGSLFSSPHASMVHDF